MKPIDLCWLTCMGAVLAFPAPALAEAPQVVPPVVSGLFDKPVAVTSLGQYRGGSDLVQNDMKLIGTTAGNTATDVTTGSNVIGAGSFSNMSGLPLVIQNSGANVLIQNAVILHLQMN